MSKKTKPTSSKADNKSKRAPATDASANDKARAAALAALTAKAPDVRPSKPTKKQDPTAKSPAPRTKPGTKVVIKRMSALGAAAQVLHNLPAKEARAGLSSQELIDRMAAAGLWSSPGGRTPAATLYAAMIREIAAKGIHSRFVRLESTDGARGRFAASAAPRTAATSSPVPSKPRHAKPTPAKAASQKGGA